MQRKFSDHSNKTSSDPQSTNFYYHKIRTYIIFSVSWKAFIGVKNLFWDFFTILRSQNNNTFNQKDNEGPATI